MQDFIVLTIVTRKQCQQGTVTVAKVCAWPDGYLYVTQFGDRPAGVFICRRIRAAAAGQ